MTFATNYLGPFALTEALVPRLPDGAHAAVVASATEDPERKSAKIAGFRGAVSSQLRQARGASGSPAVPQCQGQTLTRRRSNAFSPRRWHSSVKPRDCVSTRSNRASHQTRGSGGMPTPFLRFLANYLLPLLAPHIKYWSTPKRAAPGNQRPDRFIRSDWRLLRRARRADAWFRARA
jgi:hypothetical protein